MGVGSLAIWNVVPSGMRPSLPHSIMRKSTQTVTVDAAPAATPPDIHAVRVACGVSKWWQWMEGPPDKVHILYRVNGNVVGDTTSTCTPYRQ